jgi:hypothetical protein
LLFPTRQANTIKAKEQLFPATRLRSKVLWLHYQRQKQKAVASPPPILYFMCKVLEIIKFKFTVVREIFKLSFS